MNKKNIHVAEEIIRRYKTAEKAEKDLKEVEEDWEWMKVTVSGKNPQTGRLSKASVDINRLYTFGIFEALQKEVKAQKEFAEAQIEKL